MRPTQAAYDNYQAIIDDPLIDAVYIALSNDAHLPWTLAALDAGKAVLCEKPLGCSAAEATRMREAADARELVLVEATWNLWHPRTRRAEALLHANAIGRPVSVSGAFTIDGVADGNYRWDPAMGGGALLDVGCYPLTGAAWATADRHAPDGVVVEHVEMRTAGRGVDAATDAYLKMRGIPVHVHCAFDEVPRQTLLVEGETGLLEFTGNDAFTSWMQPSSLRVVDPDGERVEHFAPVDPYRLMVEHVTAALRNEWAWLPNPDWSLLVAHAMDDVLQHGASRSV